MLIARKGPSRAVRIKLTGEVKEARAEFGQFSRSGDILAVAFEDYSVRLFDSRTGTSGATLRGHTAAVRRIAFSADQSFAVTTSDDGTAIVWDAGRGAEIANLRLPDAIRGAQLSFSKDAASVIFVSDANRTVWRCYACGSREDLVAEIKRRKMRQLTADEATRFSGHSHSDKTAPGVRDEGKIR